MTDALIMNIASDFRELKETINVVLMQIRYKKPKISDDDFMDLRLIFSELISNAIIHGNKFDEHKKVCVVIEFADESIISSITDEGSGFNYTEKLKLENSCDDFWSVNGRGITLVSALTDELIFIGKGNEIRFSKKLAYIVPEKKTPNKNCLNTIFATAI